MTVFQVLVLDLAIALIVGDLVCASGAGVACADVCIREKSPGKCKKVGGKFADNEKLPTFAPAIEKQRSSRRSSPADVLEKKIWKFQKKVLPLWSFRFGFRASDNELQNPFQTRFFELLVILRR